MKREDFIKKRWKPFEEIMWTTPHREVNEIPPVSCMLLLVDFEGELMKLEPIDKEIYQDESFWARVENCNRPARRPRLVKN